MPDGGTVLVTGGAGYLGSHVVRRLREGGRTVVVLDDLRSGHRAAIGDTPLVEADAFDEAVLQDVVASGSFSCIVHLASRGTVAESMLDPAGWYRGALTGGLALLDLARRFAVPGVVLGSSAAVYGDPRDLPITEEHPLRPISPFGDALAAVERAAAWFHRAYGLRYVALRVGNAAGAHPEGDLGEDHASETHLVPTLLQAAGAGSRSVPIFGDDYPTTDGTCVRDFVHVWDVADAFARAVEALERREVEAETFNLGTGEGFSVREMVDAVTRITGLQPPTDRAPRRPGDAALVVLSADRALRRLGWRREHGSIEAIVRTAWNWHKYHPRGFGDAADV